MSAYFNRWYKLCDYSTEIIPKYVLEEIAKAEDLKIFTSIRIWAREKAVDPIVFGVRRWGESICLIARFGSDSLFSWQYFVDFCYPPTNEYVKRRKGGILFWRKELVKVSGPHHAKVPSPFVNFVHLEEKVEI